MCDDLFVACHGRSPVSYNLMEAAMRRLLPFLAAVSLIFVAGCTSHFDYVPHPAVTLLQPKSPEQQPQARLVVNVSGVKPAGKSPSTIRVNIRVEDLGTGPVSFDPRQATLLDAGLHDLAGPTGDLEPATLQPGQALLRSLLYTLPPGVSPDDNAFSMLNLRVTLSADGREFPHTMLFYRADYYYYPYYYYGPYPRYRYRYWW
jgi:hypothetical protein